MNTPTTRQMRPRHVPTPKMSERKKVLFGSNSMSSLIILETDEDSDLGPINPLEYSSSPTNYEPQMESFVNPGLSAKRLDFSNLMEELSPAIKNSCRISQSDNSPRRITRSSPATKVLTNVMTEKLLMDKENNVEVLLKTPGLGNNTITTPRISFRKTQNISDCSTNGTNSPKSRKLMQRRDADGKKSDASETPKAKASLSFGEISAQSFYGTTTVQASTRRYFGINQVAVKATRKKSAPARNRRSTVRQSTAKKPVLGSIRKLNNKFKAKKVVNKLATLKKRTELLNRIEKVLDSSELTTYFKEVKANNFDKELISGRLRNVLNESVKAPNKSSTPLPTHSENLHRSEEKSKHEEEDGEEEEEPRKRKFFKSKSRATKNRYQVAKGISATIDRGHGIRLLPPSKKRQKIDDGYDEMRSIQKEVQDIVKLLASSSDQRTSDEEDTFTDKKEELRSYEMEVQGDQSMCDKFCGMIPYNTTDPTEIKRQETVLGILIGNGICNEENFKIFVSEYEQHKDQAESILNNLFDISVSDDIGVLMDSTEEISSEIETVANDSSEKREFHPIFYKDHRRSDVKKDILSVPLPKTCKWVPLSDNQLQIDAGQKDFGSKNCSECGMFYTLHDPEDEVLHQKFHNNMMGVLNFKGWTDENLVENVEEWGQKGRIIWSNKFDTKVHATRVSEILEIINKDLGYANTELQEKSIVYLAISRKLVIGICVAEPLKEAHSMYTKDNVEYIDLKKVIPVKCGVSRIWVTPQFRRYGVATRLIKAVLSHFIRGYQMSSNELAFSTPTVMGKQFAQTVASNVLVYDRV